MKYILTFFNRLISISDTRDRVEMIVKILIIDFLFSLTFFLTFNGGQDLASSWSDVNRNFNFNLAPTLFLFVISIFLEEVVHRLPIALFINKNIDLRLKLFFIITLSIAFAIFHLPSFGFWETLIIIPPIFVAGISYSLIYILAGANKGKVIFPLFLVSLIHLIWDIIVFTLTGI